MKIQLFVTLASTALLVTGISLLAPASFSVTNGNPCAGVNPCAGNPCAGNPSFKRGAERANLILHQSKAYYCDSDSYRHPTVVFRSDLGNIPVFQFKVETAPDWYKKNKSYNTISRCNEIASRAVEFHEMNLVSYLRVESVNNTQALCISRLDWSHMNLVATDPDAARLVFTFIKPVDETEISDILSKIKGRTKLTETDPPQI